MNAHIRDQFLMAAQATDFVVTTETNTRTTYGDITTVGPQVTLTTSTAALVLFSAELGNNTLSAQTLAAVAVSGATTRAAVDDECIFRDGIAATDCQLMGAVYMTGLTAGSNTFKLTYRVSAGTGTWARRMLSVYAVGP